MFHVAAAVEKHRGDATERVSVPQALQAMNEQAAGSATLQQQLQRAIARRAALRLQSLSKHLGP